MKQISFPHITQELLKTPLWNALLSLIETYIEQLSQDNQNEFSGLKYIKAPQAYKTTSTVNWTYVEDDTLAEWEKNNTLGNNIFIDKNDPNATYIYVVNLNGNHFASTSLNKILLSDFSTGTTTFQKLSDALAQFQSFITDLAPHILADKELQDVIYNKAITDPALKELSDKTINDNFKTEITTTYKHSFTSVSQYKWGGGSKT